MQTEQERKIMEVFRKHGGWSDGRREEWRMREKEWEGGRAITSTIVSTLGFLATDINTLRGWGSNCWPSRLVDYCSWASVVFGLQQYGVSNARTQGFLARNWFLTRWLMLYTSPAVRLINSFMRCPKALHCNCSFWLIKVIKLDTKRVIVGSKQHKRKSNKSRVGFVLTVNGDV